MIWFALTASAILSAIFVLIILRPRFGEDYKRTGHERSKAAYRETIQRQEWANGKQVTFMESEPQLNSRVKAVDSKPICESLTRYGCKIPNCKEPHYAEVEIRRALDKRQYRYP